MRKLFKHQSDIVRLMPKRHVLSWSVGTGKTTAALALAYYANVERTLIICPKALKEHWTREATEAFKDQTEASFIVVSKEEFKKNLAKLPPCQAMIVDEAHHFFGMTSQLRKSLGWYIKKWNPGYVWLLTGTVYRSTPWDIFVLRDLLGSPIKYQDFRYKFFVDRHFGRRIVPVPRDNVEEDLAKLVGEVGSIVRLDECTDVPEQVFTEEYLSLLPEQKKAMDDLQDLTPIARFTKEHQITGGTLKESGEQYQTEKLQRAIDLAVENKHIIIVCRYNAEIDMLRDNLPGSAGEVKIIRGDVDNRDEVIRSLPTDSPWTLLVNAACSEGWEIPYCRVMLFYSYDFSLKNYIQMLGRIQRLGHIKKNVYYSLIVKDSADEDVYDAMMRKEDVHEAIMRKRYQS